MRKIADSKPLSGILLSHAALMSVGFAALFLMAALRSRIPVFLAIYAPLCIVSANLVRALKTHAAHGSPSDRRAETRALTPLIFGFAILFRLALLFSGPPLSTDIYRYIWDGRVQLAGINPYAYPPTAPELEFLRDARHALINHPALCTIYPPLAELVFRLGAALSPTLIGFKVISGLFDLATLWMLVLLLESRGLSPAWSAVYAWHPLAAFEFAGSGHVDSLMLFFLTATLYLRERRRDTLSALSLACATLSKLVPIVMIPWLLVRRDKKAMAACLGLITLACLPFAEGALRTGHGGMAVTGFCAFGRDWLANPSLFAVLGLVIPNSGTRKLVLGAGLVLGAFLWAGKTKQNPTLFALGSLFALLLCSSVVQPWYVLWLLPLLCVHPLWSGLAWTWLVGLVYLIFDPRLSAAAWHYPLWAWVWTAQYIIVYSLLGMEIVGHFAKRPMHVARASSDFL